VHGETEKTLALKKISEQLFRETGNLIAAYVLHHMRNFSRKGNV
jgi:hypothetical protein